MLSTFRKTGIAVLGVATIGLTAACSASPANDGEDAGGLVIASYGSVYTEATQEFFANPYAEANGGVMVTFVDALVGGASAAIQSQSAAGSIQWDVLDGFSGIDAWQLYRDGLLVDLPSEITSELEPLLAPGAVTPFGYSYGNTTNVIACNAAAVEHCPSDAREFFDVEGFPGNRTLQAGDPLPAVMLAARALGMTSDAVDIDAVFELLDSIRSSIRVFYTSGDQSEQIVASGEVAMGVFWDARAFSLIDKGLTDVIVTFKDGVYEPFYLAVVADSPNAQNAIDYVVWVASHPEGATGWMEKVQYGIPIPNAFTNLDPAVADRLGDNPINLDQTIAVDYEWYLDNRDEIDSRWREYVAG